MVSPSPQQCIRVLILLHGVGSKILVDAVCIVYLPVYVFGVASTVFFLLSLCFCTLLRIKVYYRRDICANRRKVHYGIFSALSPLSQDGCEHVYSSKKNGRMIETRKNTAKSTISDNQH